MKLNKATNSILISLFLVSIVLVTKLPFIVDMTIPFSFDHGKDSLAVLRMMETYRPTLIGPWTSIPGLFFGPGWYYLLLPGFILTGGHPLSGTITMMVLMAVLTYLIYKRIGLVEAIIVATAQTWFSLAQSAWNPFPIVATSFGIIMLLESAKKVKKLNQKNAFLIGICAALGFHFSTAFAIFYVPIVALLLIIYRIKTPLRSIITFCLGFFIPFLPQLLFELRNNFVEVRSVAAYIGSVKDQAKTLGTLVHILQTGLGEIKLAILPTYYGLPKLDHVIKTIVILLLVIFSLGKMKKLGFKNSLTNFLILDFLIWTSVPLIGFWMSHFNVWYLLGLLPSSVMMVGRFIRTAPKSVVGLVCILFLLSPLSKLWYYYAYDRDVLLSNRDFLSSKVRVLEFIRLSASDSSFSSYHYVPDIYDFAYQYLYFWQGLHNQKLPHEFSYQAGEIAYCKEKPSLLAKFEEKRPELLQTDEPNKIFYIVEKPANEALLNGWWNHQRHGKITQTKYFGNDLAVYVAEPEKD